ncbi:serine hydrolase domain-containing protein [Niabella beijingensis]|uniref:serine hydrolase domain-containing protein n=1 Tax=Niabella beijingensis TaxID=2872700 RepID=UPI001CBFE879|nr:serine hydrolase domain-containing protein [Niabella beijingensis]MBZ4187495.1 beta-lactamase family protein [Niabella beijingensis]
MNRLLICLLAVFTGNRLQQPSLFLQPPDRSATFQHAIQTGTAATGDSSYITQQVRAAIKLHTGEFPSKTQLSLALIQNGSVTFYGVIKEQGHLIAVNNEARIFETGSITKVFTATLLADLVVQKELGLDDRIDTCYPFAFNKGMQFSFRQLANHTSGLPRMPSNFAAAKTSPGNPYRNYNRALLEDYLKNEVTVLQAGGEKYAYSNLGAGLLGYTLGLIQKTSFPLLLKKRVLTPFNMQHTYLYPDNPEGQLVRGLDAAGNEVPNWDFDVLSGAGGLRSCASDLSLFALAQFDSTRRQLALTRIPTFRVNDRLQIGLGWHIIQTDYGTTLYWHNGGTAGYSSSMALDPASRNGVILLSNVSAFHPHKEHIDQLCFELARLIEKKAEATPG